MTHPTRTYTGPVPSRQSFTDPTWQAIAGSLNHLFAHLHEVPVLAVPVIQVAFRSELIDLAVQVERWGSVMPAVWSFMLAARSRGLGTVWTTPHLQYEREAAELLGIPYETVVQAALIPVAYTIGTDFRPGKRVPPEEIIHWDRW